MQLRARMLSAFEHFDARPALAERRPIPCTTAEVQALDYRQSDTYVSISYGQLAQRVRSVAAQLTTPDVNPELVPGDMVALLGHAGVDFTTVDFACNIAGLTTVPLQTSGTVEQHAAIIDETGPRVLAVSVTLLERAAQLVWNRPTIERIVVLDFRGGEHQHRDAVAALPPEIAARVETLDLGCQAADLDPGHTADQPVMLMFTSGSTGTPKGAVYTDRLVTEMWGGEGWSDFFAQDEGIANFHYMPMSHLAGHSSIRSTLARGGVTYFASSTNLSSFFEDLQRARPTELSLVPRVCELLHQEYQRQIGAGRNSADGEAVSRRVLTQMRETILGGRVRWASCTSAPVSAELKSFMESLLGIELHELYGSTELGGVLADGRFLQPPVIDFRLEDVPELGYFCSDRPAPRGELLIKSTSTVPGYFKHPELDSAVFTADGFYRTGDIAAVEPDGRVRIIDRKNAVVKLSQGEFVALPSLEARYVAGSELVHQVFLYGQSDQSSIVGVVVPSEQLRAETGDDLAAAQARVLQEFRRIAAAEGLNSYEIPSALIVEFEPFTESNGLLSDHRKPVRPRLMITYGERLLALYAQQQSARDAEVERLRVHGVEQDTLTTLRGTVAVAIGGDVRDIAPDARFRDLGGDSLSAVHLSRLLEQVYGVRIPVDTLVSESSTIESIAGLVDAKRSSRRRSPEFEDVHGADAQHLRADDLRLSKFELGNRPAATAPGARPGVRSVFITGASGFLGRFLCLAQLRAAQGRDSRVVCLVRANDDAAAQERLRNVFATSQELLAEFDSLAVSLDVVAGDLAEYRFGVDDATWAHLTETVTEIVHAGAMVNHALAYRELFAANVAGTAEVIRLAVTGALKPVSFMSSIATALLPADAPLDETCDIRVALPGLDPSGNLVDGYAAAKWAGEVLLREAHEHHRLPVTVFRASMMLPHSTFEGQINAPDMFIRLLYSLVRTGLVPGSFYASDGRRAHYDGLPVDVVADAVAALGPARGRDGFATFHLVNPHDDGISLDTIVDWLIEMSVPLTRIQGYDDWLHRFRAALGGLDDRERRASMLPLLAGLEHPEPPARGSLIESSRFMEAVTVAELTGRVTSLTPAFAAKCVGDLEYTFDLHTQRGH